MPCSSSARFSAGPSTGTGRSLSLAPMLFSHSSISAGTGTSGLTTGSTSSKPNAASRPMTPAGSLAGREPREYSWTEIAGVMVVSSSPPR
jgi:hypothetical protein